MPTKEIIRTEKAPKAIGPYNVATRFGELVFTAGQLGLVPETMELAEGGVAAEVPPVEVLVEDEVGDRVEQSLANRAVARRLRVAATVLTVRLHARRSSRSRGRKPGAVRNQG